MGRIGKVIQIPERGTQKSRIIKSEEIPEIMHFPSVDLDDKKSLEAYIKDAKKYCRATGMYKRLMNFIKYQFEGGNTCTFLKNVQQFRGSHVKIQMHHSGGFTISDIIETVLRKRILLGEDYRICAVCKEVMKLHYEGKIGINPLSETMHKLVHVSNEPREDGSYMEKLFIPLQYVFYGNPLEFKLKYEDYMSPKLRDKVEQYLLCSAVIEEGSKFIPDYVEPEILYYDIEGQKFPSMARIDEILNGLNMENEQT